MFESITKIFQEIPLWLYRLIHARVQANYFPQKALVIVAHPDDPEYFFAGTIARWVRGGTVARYIICTSGQLGNKDRSLSAASIASLREKEQIAAANSIGVHEVVFLGHQDGFLENTIVLRRQLVREIRLFRPEVVIINDPTLFYGDDFINHPDHRAAAVAALEAIYPHAGLQTSFMELEAEQIQPYHARCIYIQTWQKPNLWVDITDTIDQKILALSKHTSQIGQENISEKLRESAARSAKFTGIKYAETFRVITLINDSEWNESIKTIK